ncbi:hypothetical protein ILYODFUR_026571 [Ilyodon furcidens]|uniref:Uncharacterized protein n=1 Tax=Ilyodon furcidens TaxID=33524 RepID=A0ABV0U8P1_9TELE
MSENILAITEEHPTPEKVLKEDLFHLLNKVEGLSIKVFLSRPFAPIFCGDEIYSRLLMINKWLKACATTSVNFIDNFNIFWEKTPFQARWFLLEQAGSQTFHV